MKKECLSVVIIRMNANAKCPYTFDLHVKITALWLVDFFSFVAVGLVRTSDEQKALCCSQTGISTKRQWLAQWCVHEATRLVSPDATPSFSFPQTFIRFDVYEVHF